MNLNNVINSARKCIAKNSPEILIGLGIAGFVSSTVLAVKATPKAIKLLEEAKENKKEELTNVEKVKVVWKEYAPSVIFGILSVSCVITSRTINAKRGAALATAYAISENALVNYKNKVIETLGEEKEKDIQKKVNDEKLKNNPVNNKEIIVTGTGESLCYDSISGRYFKSDIETIKNIINKLNRRMNYDMYVSLSDLYYELGIDKIKNSDYLGWKLDDGLIEIMFDSKLCEDGTPAIVLDYNIEPKYNYDILR